MHRLRSFKILFYNIWPNIQNYIHQKHFMGTSVSITAPYRSFVKALDHYAYVHWFTQGLFTTLIFLIHYLFSPHLRQFGLAGTTSKKFSNLFGPELEIQSATQTGHQTTQITTRTINFAWPCGKMPVSGMTTSVTWCTQWLCVRLSQYAEAIFFILFIRTPYEISGHSMRKDGTISTALL